MVSALLPALRALRVWLMQIFAPRRVIRAELHPRLIGELPRMFGGWEARFREILQNAYRAGADRVDITVSDNGRGCAHPGLLIFAGATGWDESQVIEPAGVGLFSLLNKTAVCRVEVESRGRGRGAG